MDSVKKAYRSIRRRSRYGDYDQSKSNGAVNGDANGAANGHANGHANGNANANGTANGHANGAANGTAAAHSMKPPAPVKGQTIGRADLEPSTGKHGKDVSSHEGTHEQNFAKVFKDFANVLEASRKPLPTKTGDGSYLEEKPHHSIFSDLKTFGVKDYDTLLKVIRSKVSGGLVDDRTMLMEKTIQLVANLPDGSPRREELTDAFIDELWCSLQHPPMMYMGDKYKYRQADGSHNNPFIPDMGKANTPYARSVKPDTLMPGALPDPGVIFDSVMARNEFKEHPNKISSWFFYWASCIIHDLFQTDHRDMNISQTSSYLDLSTLYGDTKEDQDQIRTFKDGRLKPDCFAEERLLAFPPGAGLILIMFNRFHNYVVHELADINENGRFTKPDPRLPTEQAELAWQKYDEDLFQTGRLITCGLYINITLTDYVRTIVNVNRTNSTWTLDPRAEMGKVFGKEGTPSGVGSQVSAEFNLVYRWHACTSLKDEAWTEEMFKQMFGKPADEVSMQDLLMGLGKWEKSLDKDPHKRPFAGLVRQADGTYNDDDLVRIATESIEDVGGAFGANNTPKALRAIQIMGIMQARKWGLGTLNEFRKFFGLQPHKTFEEINSDPQVAEQLKHLYDHPDYVEMYTGIVAEEAKAPMIPGSGVGPTYTLSRAILSDAVCLVRGDRFYTLDWHPQNVTNWGYSEVATNTAVDKGCVFYKLFARAFPDHFKNDSIYAHFPMTIPSENRKVMRDLGCEHMYSYDRPALIPARINVTSYKGAKAVLENQEAFKVTWGETLTYLMGKGGSDFMLSGDEPLHAKQRQLMAKCLYLDNWHAQVKEFYEHITLKLLHEKKFKLAGINYVDVTRDVGNLAHVHFASNVFRLPLKDGNHPHGILTEQQMYMAVAVIFTCIFFDIDAGVSFPLHLAAKAISEQLGKLVELNVEALNSKGLLGRVITHQEAKDNTKYLSNYGVHMIKHLLESGLGAKEIAWSQVLPTAIAMVPNQAQVFTQVLDYYLSPAGKEHLPEINRLAKLDTPEADEKILHYAMEGIRMNGTFGSYRECVSTLTIDDEGKQINVKPGDKVFVSFIDRAAKDPVAFPEPDKIRLDRPIESYLCYGEGPHQCLGKNVSRVALTAMLKTVGRLDNLRRAPGPRGELKKVPRPGGFYAYMRDDLSSIFPFPLSMQVCWDGELPPLTEI